jgi:hypothetical protein
MNDMTIEFLLILSIITNFMLGGAITWFRLQLAGHSQHIGELYEMLDEKNGGL